MIVSSIFFDFLTLRVPVRNRQKRNFAQVSLKNEMNIKISVVPGLPVRTDLSLVSSFVKIDGEYL